MHIEELNRLLALIKQDQTNTKEHINLVASENILSPLAQYPYQCDLHNRYYLDDIKRFNKWLFVGGEIVQSLEDELLIPLLKSFSKAQYVNVRPISGMNCMTVALAGLTEIGDTIFSISSDHGGHVSTAVIANRFGLNLEFIPFKNPYDIDYDKLRAALVLRKPKLVYIDQSTFLFPIHPQQIRSIIDEVSPDTVLHYDSSHLNGLIFGNATFNPLDAGAHLFGGSTHKTLPGPHKGFIATNSEIIHKKINEAAQHFVSHHHPSSLLSLAITLLEMKYCRGDNYAQSVLDNAKTLAKSLADNGFVVGAESRGYTQSHQVWAYPDTTDSLDSIINDLSEIGIIVTRFDGLPGISREALRLSVSEITKLGFTEESIKQVASIMGELVYKRASGTELKLRVKSLREQHPVAEYCFKYDDVRDNQLPAALDFIFSKNPDQLKITELC